MLLGLYLQCFSVTVLISAIVLLLLYLVSVYVKSVLRLDETEDFDVSLDLSSSCKIEDLSYEEINTSEALTLSKYPDFPQSSSVTIFDDVFCDDETTDVRKS